MSKECQHIGQNNIPINIDPIPNGGGGDKITPNSTMSSRETDKPSSTWMEGDRPLPRIDVFRPNRVFDRLDLFATGMVARIAS